MQSIESHILMRESGTTTRGHLVQTTVVVFLILSFVSGTPASFNLGELEPYCQNPFKYPSSLKPYSGGTLFKSAFLEGTWYESVRHKDLYILEGCSCGIATFGSAQPNLENQLLTFACSKNGQLWKRNVVVTVVNPTQTWLKVDLGIDALNLYVLAFDETDFRWVLFGDTCRRGYVLYSVVPSSLSEEVWKSQVQPVLKRNGFSITAGDLVWSQTPPASVSPGNTSSQQKITCSAELPDQRKGLKSPEGSDARNGVWTPDEVRQVLDARRAKRARTI